MWSNFSSMQDRFLCYDPEIVILCTIFGCSLNVQRALLAPTEWQCRSAWHSPCLVLWRHTIGTLKHCVVWHCYGFQHSWMNTNGIVRAAFMLELEMPMLSTSIRMRLLTPNAFKVGVNFHRSPKKKTIEQPCVFAGASFPLAIWLFKHFAPQSNSHRNQIKTFHLRREEASGKHNERCVSLCSFHSCIWCMSK